MVDALNIRPNVNDDLLISVQELKDWFLFGIDMRGDDGEPYPETMFEFYIRAAQNWLATELPGIMLCDKLIEDTKDYYINDYVSFGALKLNWFPVTTVEEVSIQFPLATNVLKFDPSWYRCESISGHVNLVPTQGTFSSIILSQGGSFLPLFYSGMQHLPFVWHIKYRAGFRKGEFPQSMKEIIGMKAAMGPLNIAGDLIAGAGIASKSIGLDGLSQSISTTASATNAGYGARILQYNKEIKERMSAMKSHYCGMQMSIG